MIIYYFFVINHQEEINKLKNEINDINDNAHDLEYEKNNKL